MKSLLLCSIALFALVSLNSCSSGLGRSELSAISSVSVRQATIAPASYGHPSAFEHGDNGRSVQSGTGAMGSIIGMASSNNDFGGYLIGGILGQAVGHGIAKNQHTNFRHSYGRYFSSLRGKVPGDLTNIVTSGIKSHVKANRFFGPRLRDQGSHQFTVSVKRHSLSRYGSNSHTGHPLMSAYVELEVVLYGPGRRVLYHKTFLGKSRSAIDIPTLANNSNVSRNIYREAVMDACNKFARDLRRQSGH